MNLTGIKAKDSYRGILNLAGSNQVLDSTLRTVTDGMGNASPLDLSNNAVRVNGDSTVRRLIDVTNTPAVAAGAVTVNCSLGLMHNITLVTGTPTAITLTNPAVGSYILILKQSAGGSALATFATTIIWSGGIAPVLTTTANAVDIITLIYDGTTWRGAFTPNFAS